MEALASSSVAPFVTRGDERDDRGSPAEVGGIELTLWQIVLCIKLLAIGVEGVSDLLGIGPLVNVLSRSVTLRARRLTPLVASKAEAGPEAPCSA